MTRPPSIEPDPSVEGGVEASVRMEEMSRNEKIRIEQHSISGMLWFTGWLFTIGYMDLTFWKGVLALLVWPYYLGTTFG